MLQNESSMTESKDTERLYQEGLEHLEKGELEDAVSNFNQVIQLDKRYAQAFKGRAEAYHGLGKEEEATQDEMTYNTLRAAGLATRSLSPGLPASQRAASTQPLAPRRRPTAPEQPALPPFPPVGPIRYGTIPADLRLVAVVFIVFGILVGIGGIFFLLFGAGSSNLPYGGAILVVIGLITIGLAFFQVAVGIALWGGEGRLGALVICGLGAVVSVLGLTGGGGGPSGVILVVFLAGFLYFALRGSAFEYS
ncbi:MAG: tetratricopeptide repeat protein [Chloroflexi bacterium]|nr:tetratricopeptide repeat protein [Chloroflexota bacterium]